MATKESMQDQVDDAVSGFEGAVDQVRAGAKKATTTASKSVNRVIDRGANGAKRVADRVPAVTQTATAQLDDVRDRVRAEPLKMVAIAVGIGALFGAFLTR